MLSARAIAPIAEIHKVNVNVRFVDDTRGKRLEFEQIHKEWIRCNRKGQVEIGIGKIGNATIEFFPANPGLSFEGFVLIPEKDSHGRTPSSNGFRFSVGSNRIALHDHHESDDSLGSFRYTIYYRVATSDLNIHQKWDPEIVNRGELGGIVNRPRRPRLQPKA